MRAQTELPMQPENQRECARDQPEVVEVRMQKAAGQMRFEQPAVERVRSAAEEEQRVAQPGPSMPPQSEAHQ